MLQDDILTIIRRNKQGHAAITRDNIFQWNKQGKKEIKHEDQNKKKQREKRYLHEKTRAAAAPRKPKKGAVSSPLKVDMFDYRDIGSPLFWDKTRISRSDRRWWWWLRGRVNMTMDDYDYSTWNSNKALHCYSELLEHQNNWHNDVVTAYWFLLLWAWRLGRVCGFYHFKGSCFSTRVFSWFI